MIINIMHCSPGFWQLFLRSRPLQVPEVTLNRICLQAFGLVAIAAVKRGVKGHALEYVSHSRYGQDAGAMHAMEMRKRSPVQLPFSCQLSH